MRIYNRYPSEEEAQEAFATFCTGHMDCEHCPLHQETMVPGSERLVPGGLSEKSCAIHWLYSRWHAETNKALKLNGSKKEDL